MHVIFLSFSIWFQAEGVAPTHYYEVDFPEVTKKKAAIMANREALHKLVGPGLEQQDTGIFSSAFCLLSQIACSLSRCYTQSHLSSMHFQVPV